MRLIVLSKYTGEEENTYLNYEGDLCKIFPMENVDMCFLDGIKTDHTQGELIVDNSARVTLHMKPPGVDFLVAVLISAAISTILSMVTAALFKKKAKKPKLAQLRSTRPEESPTYAFEGIQDTIAAGSPIPFILGQARKGGQVISTRVELIDDGKNQKLYMLLCMGHGEIHSVSDVEINGSKITNFSGTSFSYKVGAASQSAIADFEHSVDQTYFDGREFTDASIVYTTKTNVDRVDLFIGALGGIFHNTDTGDFQDNTSNYKVEYRPQTSAGEAWVLHKNDFVKGRTTNQKFKIHTIVFSTKDTYEIRITWVSATFTDESQDGWSLFLHNIVEKVDETRTYDNYAVLGIVAVSTAQLNGRLPNVTAIVKGKVRDVNDSYIFTENNAWNIREILRNTTWGLGHRLPDSFFETTTWTTLANYCDATEDGFDGSANQEARHKINYVGDTKLKGWDLVNNLLSMCDSSLVFSEGKLKVVIDKAQSATQLYSDANTVKNSLVVSYSRAERKINTVNGRYFNVDEGYKSDFVKVLENDPLTEPEKVEDLELIGVSRQSEAVRTASRHLKENIYRKKEYSWKSPLDAIVSEPGDLVKRQFYVSTFERGHSGYVLGGNTEEVYLDKIVTLSAGKTYEIFIRHKTKNTFVQEDIANAAGEWGKVVLSSALTLAASEGDLYAIGEKNVSVIDVLLEEVNQQSDGTFVLRGVNYDTNIYTVDALPSQITRNRMPIGDIPPLAIENWTVRESVEVLPDGTIGSFLEFDILPGMLKNAGTSLGATSSTIDLSVDEPNRHEFFINATITITAGTGVGQSRTILAYDGLLRRVTSLNSNWSNTPDTTSEYVIDFVKAGNYHGAIVEFSNSDQTEWFEMGRIMGTVGSLPIRGQGAIVYLRLIPFTVTDKRNELALLTRSITTTGKDDAPSNISNFSVVQINHVLLFTWSNIPDLDIGIYEIRQGTSWNQSLFVGESKQNFWETTEFAAGDKTFWIKAKDQTGNESITAASFVITLESSNPRQVFSTTDELASLGGTFDGLAVRGLITSYGNGISLASKNTWDSGFYWDTALSAVTATQAVEVWDGATLLIGTYITQTFNLGAIAYARIFADIGFQDSEGVILTVEEQHSDDDISYSDWRIVGAGDQKWQYARLRITLTVTDSADDPIMNKFDVIIDALVRIYRGIGVSVPTGAGTVVTFTTSYIQTPNIEITERDQAPIVYNSSPSKTGFTLKHDGGGTSTIDWRSEGI